jgi:aminotransferase
LAKYRDLRRTGATESWQEFLAGHAGGEPLRFAPRAAAVAALEQGEAHVQHMVGEYDRRRKLLVRELNTMGLTCFEPRGAFYCFPDVSASGMNGDVFANTLLAEEEVALVPGSAFGFSGANHVRIAYAQSYEKIETAIERMYRFMKKHG